jgi:hypothetical protein
VLAVGVTTGFSGIFPNANQLNIGGILQQKLF